MPTSACRTVMAFDYGLRQIGAAVGNCLTATTQALKVLRAQDGAPDWDALTALVQEWQPDLLLVGDPLNMDDSQGDMSDRARRFARRLEGRLGLPVEMVDERLSSYEAKRLARDEGHRGDYRRQPVDSIAAELILRSWLQSGARRPVG